MISTIFDVHCILHTFNCFSTYLLPLLRQLSYNGAPVFVSRCEYNFRKPRRCDTISWSHDREICEKRMKNDEVANRLLPRTSFPPLRWSSCASSRPSFNFLTHLLAIESLMARFSYVSQNRRSTSAGFTFLSFKKWTTERISQTVSNEVLPKTISLFRIDICQWMKEISMLAHNKACAASQ